MTPALPASRLPEGTPAEDRKERVDRELLELLNELRIELPGAQVPFAFLLTLPFTFRFEELTRTHRAAYFAAFLCTTVGTVLLMASSANHRLRFRERDKARMLFWFNRLTLAGSVFVAAAIALVVFVVTVALRRAVGGRGGGPHVTLDRRRLVRRSPLAARGQPGGAGAAGPRRCGPGRPRQSDENPTGMRTSFWREPSSIDWL